MKPMTKWTPIAILAMMGSGALLFDRAPLGAGLLPVTVLGALIFFAGLLFGAIGLKRSLVTLSNADARRATGLGVPIATILLAGGTWLFVLAVVIHVRMTVDNLWNGKVETAGVEQQKR